MTKNAGATQRFSVSLDEVTGKLYVDQVLSSIHFQKVKPGHFPSWIDPSPDRRIRVGLLIHPYLATSV